MNEQTPEEKDKKLGKKQGELRITLHFHEEGSKTECVGFNFPKLLSAKLLKELALEVALATDQSEEE